MASFHILSAFAVLLVYEGHTATAAANFNPRAEDCPNLGISSEWDTGYDGKISFDIDHDTGGSWQLHLTFDKALISLDCWEAQVSTTDNINFVLSGNTDHQAGSHVEIQILPRYSSKAYLILADIDGQDICGGPSRTTTTTTTTKGPTTTTTLASTLPPSPSCEDIISNIVNNGQDLDITIDITPETDIESWVIEIHFNKDVTSVSTPAADVTGRGKIWMLTSKSWSGSIPAGKTFELSLSITFENSEVPSLGEVLLNTETICGGPAPTTTQTPPTTTTPESSYTPDHPAKYTYGDVLEKTLLFYEAQRSGPLPSSNRVDWRGNSGMGDAVLGGYHDAGDHVKFGFPMAAFTTVLAWGGINFRSGYEKSGQLDYLVECLKWSTDYFIGCHTSDFEFIGQIGDGYDDHAFWGRPEDMTMARPAFSITSSSPGSELAGETAAALASSAIFYRMVGMEADADECLAHAKKLYEFADTYRGMYIDAIPAEGFYNDWGGYNDEIVWAAAWVAMATGDPTDIATAEAKYQELGISGADPSEISWDDKNAMVFLIMYQLTGKEEYKSKAEAFSSYILGAERTGKGLIWISSSEWGSLRYAANFAMYAVQAVHNNIMQDEMFAFAESQVNYILGDTGRSYVVGWGSNPPERCHHRAASCPDAPSQCDWSNKDSPNPNPQILNGALVGGPDHSDNYIDDRNNFAMTEVADDYNAGFQTALAGLNNFFQ